MQTIMDILTWLDDTGAWKFAFRVATVIIERLVKRTKKRHPRE